MEERTKIRGREQAEEELCGRSRGPDRAGRGRSQTPQKELGGRAVLLWPCECCP